MQFIRNINRYRIANHRSKLAIIRKVIARKELKVVFFGRTSSGKSSAINALLQSKVLPTGLGYVKNILSLYICI